VKSLSGGEEGCHQSCLKGSTLFYMLTQCQLNACLCSLCCIIFLVSFISNHSNKTFVILRLKLFTLPYKDFGPLPVLFCDLLHDVRRLLFHHSGNGCRHRYLIRFKSQLWLWHCNKLLFLNTLALYFISYCY